MGDSILSVGLDLADETEKSVREMAGEETKEVSGDTLQTPQVEQEQAELQELRDREIAQAVLEREEAEKAQEMEHDLER